MTDRVSSPFSNIHLAWQGKTFSIPATRVMGAIKRVEDHVTLGELQGAASRGSLKLGRIAAAGCTLGLVEQNGIGIGTTGIQAKQNGHDQSSGKLSGLVRFNLDMAAKAGTGQAAVRRKLAKNSRWCTALMALFAFAKPVRVGRRTRKVS